MDLIHRIRLMPENKDKPEDLTTSAYTKKYYGASRVEICRYYKIDEKTLDNWRARKPRLFHGAVIGYVVIKSLDKKLDEIKTIIETIKKIEVRK